MRKIMMVMIVVVLLFSLVSAVSADPGNGAKAYTIPDPCGGGQMFVIMNHHTVGGFLLGVKGSIGILKGIYVEVDGAWQPLLLVPGKGLEGRTETCIWEEDGFLWRTELFLPHEQH